MNAAAREPATCSESHQRRELEERWPLGAWRKLEARREITKRPFAEGPSTKTDTPRTVASALLSSVRGCHASAFAVPMSKYSACKCPKGVLHVSRHLRRHLWQSRRCPPLISYARSNLRWTVPHAAQILCSLLRQLMWRYRATTYRLIQCTHRYKMVGMLECACAPTHLYARVSVGPCRFVGG